MNSAPPEKMANIETEIREIIDKKRKVASKRKQPAEKESMMASKDFIDR